MPSPGARAAAAAGLRWLVDLPNRDGGIPAVCRGWGGAPGTLTLAVRLES